jgi:hypothetical protein
MISDASNFWCALTCLGVCALLIVALEVGILPGFLSPVSEDLWGGTTVASNECVMQGVDSLGKGCLLVVCNRRANSAVYGHIA